MHFSGSDPVKTSAQLSAVNTLLFVNSLRRYQVLIVAEDCYGNIELQFLKSLHIPGRLRNSRREMYLFFSRLQ